MSELPAQVEELAPARAELTPAQLVERLEIIKEAMRTAMVKGVDYGVIPGCKKPSLLQPGAEKLCTLFQLAPEYQWTKEWLPETEHEWRKGERKGICKGFIRYECNCRLTHSASGNLIAGGVGVANNWEPKFVSRDPYEIEETILQFARKRALVNAVRTGTAASAIFTQDVEDQPGVGGNGNEKGESSEPTPKCPDCGKPMALRTAKQGPNKGNQFWGCTGYPNCKGILSVDDAGKDEGEIVYPEGFGPDIALPDGSKHKGQKLCQVSNKYLEDLREKATGVWPKVAIAELRRREQEGITIEPDDGADSRELSDDDIPF